METIKIAESGDPHCAWCGQGVAECLHEHQQDEPGRLFDRLRGWWAIAQSALERQNDARFHSVEEEPANPLAPVLAEAEAERAAERLDEALAVYSHVRQEVLAALRDAHASRTASSG